MNISHQRKLDILNNNIFSGLNQILDNQTLAISHFTKADFEIVLKRVEQQGIGINGIEVFLHGEFYGVRTFEEYHLSPKDSMWYYAAFSELSMKHPDVVFSASFNFDS
ncbi:hypothetical protein [Pedobacter miscanthi]|uniref:hypothetical protein n=1 Tax=Pedobacter miscanthi TaxID=2259170 RepID=UPI002930FF39|nr:hypothetical protein [Pedobacter miscanthi]